MKNYEVYFTCQGRPVTKLSDIITKAWYGGTVWLYYKNVFVGSADLKRHGDNNVSTTSVSLDRAFRKKGHGIVLYEEVIKAAKSLGCRRIYSDHRLNKHSKRMWDVKLAKIFKVETLPGGCRNSCRHCRARIARRFIRLKKAS